MKLFSRNKPQERRPLATQDTAGKAPIMRYYRPESMPAARTPRTLKETSEESGFKAKLKSRNWAAFIMRSAGGIAILLVILANFTLGGLALSTSDHSGFETAFRETNVYQDKINELLKSTPINATKLTFNSKKLEEQIHESFPEVSVASAIIPLVGRKVDVRLWFDRPMMRIIRQNNEQGVLGQNGVLLLQDDASVINERFASLPSLSVPGVEAIEGEQLLTKEEAELLSLLISEFDGSQKHRPKLRAVEFNIKKREMRARFDKRSYYAKLTPERPARGQVGSLVAALRKLEEEGRRPNDFVDVRVDERVFVK